MTSVLSPIEQRLVLNAVSWGEYTRLRRLFGDRPVRLTYDRGTLEIKTLSPETERFKHLLRRLIDVLTEELGLKSVGFGSMTIQRRRRGLEPDECYYIANQPKVRGADHIDLRGDPPPDLALEIDISQSSLDRLSIYAALGVPEVWRYENQTVVFHLLGPDGQYRPGVTSRSLSNLMPADLTSILAMRFQLEDDNELVRRFRAWVRQNLAGTSPGP
jgi:Uma2 family endonuclease